MWATPIGRSAQGCGAMFDDIARPWMTGLRHLDTPTSGPVHLQDREAQRTRNLSAPHAGPEMCRQWHAVNCQGCVELRLRHLHGSLCRKRSRQGCLWSKGCELEATAPVPAAVGKGAATGTQVHEAGCMKRAARRTVRILSHVIFYRTQRPWPRADAPHASPWLQAGKFCMS